MKEKFPNKLWRNGKGPTCTCGAYEFPHRLGGGLCDAVSFVEALRKKERMGDCKYCILDSKGECQVLSGLESAHYCPALYQYRESYGVKDSPLYENDLDDLYQDLPLLELELEELEYELDRLNINPDTSPSVYQDLLEEYLSVKEYLRSAYEEEADDVPF